MDKPTFLTTLILLGFKNHSDESDYYHLNIKHSQLCYNHITERLTLYNTEIDNHRSAKAQYANEDEIRLQLIQFIKEIKDGARVR